MRSPGINGEGELRGQPANSGSPGKMAVKTECVCVCVCAHYLSCFGLVISTCQVMDRKTPLRMPIYLRRYLHKAETEKNACVYSFCLFMGQ